MEIMGEGSIRKYTLIGADILGSKLLMDASPAQLSQTVELREHRSLLMLVSPLVL